MEQQNRGRNAPILDAGTKPEWETLVSIGVQLVEHQTTSKWALGDLAIETLTYYGENSVGKLAGDIRIERSRLYRYRAMSAFYLQPQREQYPDLSHSHFREAMRMEDIEDAMRWLQQAADNEWTVEQLHVEMSKEMGHPVPPVKLADTAATIRDVSSEGLCLFAAPPDMVQELMRAWLSEKVPTVRLVVYESEEV